MKAHLKVFWENRFVDGHDKADWMFLDKHNISHADYDENCSKQLFAVFWPEFKKKLDNGECPPDISPKKLITPKKAASPAASTTSPAPAASTTSPAPAQKLTYEYSAELPMPAHPFTFGGPSVVDIGDEESEEEVLQKVIKKSMDEEEEDEDDDDDAPYTGGVVPKEPLDGAKTKKK